MTYQFVLDSEIDERTVRQLTDWLTTVSQAPDAESIQLIINSPGGLVTDGLALHDLIADAAQSINVKAVITGMCASAATYAACAATEVSIMPSATYMIHEPEVGIYGDLAVLITQTEYIRSLRERIINIYAKKTGKSADEIVSMLNPATYMTAEEAVNQGFCDRVEDTGVLPTETDSTSVNPSQDGNNNDDEPDDRPTNKLFRFKVLEEKCKNTMATLLGRRNNNINDAKNLQNKITEQESVIAGLRHEIKALNAEMQNVKNSVAKRVAQHVASLGLAADTLPAPQNVQAPEIVPGMGIAKALNLI